MTNFEPLGILASNLSYVLIIQRSTIISKTDDLELDLKDHIGLYCKVIALTFKLTHLEFCFTLEMFIDHLKVSDEFETSDLDLDL